MLVEIRDAHPRGRQQPPPHRQDAAGIVDPAHIALEQP